MNINDIKRAAKRVNQTPEQWLAGQNSIDADAVHVAQVCNDSSDRLSAIIERAASGIVCGVCGSDVDESRTCYGCGTNV